MYALTDSARRKKSVLVAGLDPVPARLPPEVSAPGGSEADAVLEFCLGVLEAVEPEVAAVKLQSAYFERLGPPGMQAYAEVLKAAADLELPTIADVKRGDIGGVAAAYAEAHLGVYGATCVTVDPYMGTDAVLPFLEETRRRRRGGGAFVLVATSNPSAARVQDSGEPPLIETIAGLVAEVGERTGEGLYPDAGAVVGATRPEVGRRVRGLLPGTLFLSPGYGAQGGDASSIRSLLDERRAGVLVNSSRAVIYAYEAVEGGRNGYREAARKAARRTREELGAIGARM